MLRKELNLSDRLTHRAFGVELSKAKLPLLILAKCKQYSSFFAFLVNTSKKDGGVALCSKRFDGIEPEILRDSPLYINFLRQANFILLVSFRLFFMLVDTLTEIVLTPDIHFIVSRDCEVMIVATADRGYLLVR